MLFDFDLYRFGYKFSHYSSLFKATDLVTLICSWKIYTESPGIAVQSINSQSQNTRVDSYSLLQRSSNTGTEPQNPDCRQVFISWAAKSPIKVYIPIAIIIFLIIITSDDQFSVPFFSIWIYIPGHSIIQA